MGQHRDSARSCLTTYHFQGQSSASGPSKSLSYKVSKRNHPTPIASPHCGTEQQCRNAAKWPYPARSQSAVHAVLMPEKALSATTRDRRFFRRTQSPVLGARMPETAFFTISYHYRFFRVFPCFSAQLTTFPAFFRAFPRSFSHVPAHLYRSVRLHSVLLPTPAASCDTPASRCDLTDDRPPGPLSRRGRAGVAQGPRRGRAGRSNVGATAAAKPPILRA